ncbi:hypothetical protein GCM10010411_74370 [Actinomadura fulvescens]|uniref:Uncharacterized protein n=1 Tax=Actinomadura fulvescens TaxID=46160 RepID=A0ABP6CXA3_9ACTN
MTNSPMLPGQRPATTGPLTGEDILKDHDVDPDALRDAVVEYMCTQRCYPRGTAMRMFGQAIVLLHYLARNPELALAPSQVVDEAVDALAVHTPYWNQLGAVLLDGVPPVGDIEPSAPTLPPTRILHHLPHVPGESRTTPDGRRVIPPAKVAALLRQAGYAVDEELWPTDEAGDSAGDCCLFYSEQTQYLRPFNRQPVVVAAS